MGIKRSLNLPAAAPSPRRRGAEDAVQGLHDGRGRPRLERVVNALCLAPRSHDAFGPQHREMLRERRLAECELALQRRDRSFSLGEEAENLEPLRIGECPHQPRRVVRMFAHLGDGRKPCRVPPASRSAFHGHHYISTCLFSNS